MALIDFILKAKKSGYAAGGEGKQRLFEDGARGFEWVADGYRYLDRYYGFNPFSGSEYVFNSDNVLTWTMNYYGEVLATHLEPNIVYAFLKQAMASITPEYPFRGPAKLEKGNLRYQNEQNGTLDRFYGVESIYDGKDRVYYLHYHGGRMIETA